jgi:hypothetical protein
VQSARELELDVDEPEAVRSAIEAAASAGDHMVWFTDTRGHQYGVVVDKLAFFEIEYAKGKKGLGFASHGQESA